MRPLVNAVRSADDEMGAKKPKRRKRPKQPIHGLSLKDEAKCLRRWRVWIRRIKSEVGDLLGRREIFIGIRNVLQLNRDIGEPRALVCWMMQNYVEATTIGVRRLCDTRDDVESLSRLLRELLQYPGVLSLASHARLYPARHRERARASFQSIAGHGRVTLSERSLRRDLRRLEDSATRIQRFVNKRVAHAAPRHELRRGPTYGQLSVSLRTLDEITVKYLVLLTGDGYSTCAPVRQYDWRRVLLQPWLEESDLVELNAMS
jgi:hypothetical protein